MCRRSAVDCFCLIWLSSGWPEQAIVLVTGVSPIPFNICLVAWRKSYSDGPRAFLFFNIFYLAFGVAPKPHTATRALSSSSKNKHLDPLSQPKLAVFCQNIKIVNNFVLFRWNECAFTVLPVPTETKTKTKLICAFFRSTVGNARSFEMWLLALLVTSGIISYLSRWGEL